MTTALELASPYKGLAPFEDSDLDALLFFGRERESDVVAMNLIGARLTVLYGPTGVGKSSLLSAGVARRLRELAPEADVVVFSSWRDDPVVAIRDLIAPGEDGSLFDAVATRRDDLYLVLDQFEEYFLYHGEAHGGDTLIDQLPDIVNGDVPVNVLLGIREDSLAKLDAFKTRLPRLFGNYLRLDHLDREAGRDAILGPLAQYGELTGDEWGAQPELVEAVLDEVAAGKIDMRRPGRALVPHGRRRRVESPFLQLVLQRLWEVERERGSTTLTLGTLRALGGAEQIVEDHLERAMGTLTPAQQDAAATMFGHLVTPSGSKIAHRLSDLATYALLETTALKPVVGALERERILRPLRDGANGDGSYEIYHDVLADAVLLWRQRHEAQRELVEERRRAQDRARRTLIALGIVALALAVMTTLTVYAFSQRSEARKQAALARDRQVEVVQKNRDLRGALADVKKQRRRAEVNRREAVANSHKLNAALIQSRNNADQAQRNAHEAQHNADVAETNAIAYQQEKEHSDVLAQQARASADRAQQNEARARQSEKNAQHTSQLLAERNEDLAAKNKELAAKNRSLAAGRLVALAHSEVDKDPLQGLRHAIQASRIETSDRVEDALRETLLALRIRAILPSEGRAITAAAYSADGAFIGIASEAGVRIFRAGDFKRAHTFDNGSATTIAFTRDGTRVASGSKNGSVTVWDVRTGAVVHTLTLGASVTAIDISPDGHLLAAGDASGRVRVYDAASFLELYSYGHSLPVRTVLFSPNAKLLVSHTAAAAARVVDALTGVVVATPTQQGEITAAAWSPTGVTMTTAGTRNGYLWDARTWERRHLLPHGQAIHAVAYSFDGSRVATAGGDGVAHVWSVETGDDLFPLVGRDELSAIAFGSDGTVATGSTDRTLRIFTQIIGPPRLTLAGHTGTVTQVVFAPDARTILSGSDDGTARAWDTQAEPRVEEIDRHEGGVTSVESNGDGRIVVSGGGDGVAKVWVRGSGSVALPHGGKRVTAALTKDSNRVLTWGDDGNAVLWTLRGKRLSRFEHGAPVVAAVISADGSRLVTAGADGRVKLWRANGSRVWSAEHGAALTDVAFSPNGDVVATSGMDGAVRIWAARNGALLHLLQGHTAAISEIAFSPDGSALAAASLDETLTVWSVLKGALKFAPIEARDLGLTSVEFSPDGRLILTAGIGGDVETWNARNGQAVKVFHGHVATVFDARFSHDGRWVITAGPTAAGLWRTTTAERQFYLRGHSLALQTALFSGDDRWIFTGGLRDGTIRQYRCEICAEQSGLERYARSRLAAIDRANRNARGV